MLYLPNSRFLASFTQNKFEKKEHNWKCKWRMISRSKNSLRTLVNLKAWKAKVCHPKERIHSHPNYSQSFYLLERLAFWCDPECAELNPNPTFTSHQMSTQVKAPTFKFTSLNTESEYIWQTTFSRVYWRKAIDSRFKTLLQPDHTCRYIEGKVSHHALFSSGWKLYSIIQFRQYQDSACKLL